jgi:hypothetical protein
MPVCHVCTAAVRQEPAARGARAALQGPDADRDISDAALFRAIQKLHPTLLFDEVDSVFGPKARDREDLRGMLNAGYRRGAVAYRMGGANNTTLEGFDVYSAKCFAGIGELPATIHDRAIRIRLERRIRDQEPVERFRRRDADAGADPIRESIRSLSDHHAPYLADARPTLPDELDDRAQDVWEPLLAIAELAGGGWPESARRAAIALSSSAEREDDSLSVLLLRDIYIVFAENGTDPYRTANLIAELAQIEESPWGDWYGKTISPQALGRLLKPYLIRTMPVWTDGQKAGGYRVEQFEEAFLRVLGGRGGRGGRSGSQSQNDLPPPTALSEEGGRSEPSSHAASTTPTALHANNGNQPDSERRREHHLGGGVR